jgi:hypothetical protein
MTSTPNVVNLGDFRVTKVAKRHVSLTRPQANTPCNHLHVTLDDNGNVVTCDDCGVQIDPYYALHTLSTLWGSFQSDLERRIAKCTEAEEITLHLRAAKVVEQAWRDKQMVPTCPHCEGGIRASDRFGMAAINNAMDERQRALRAERKLMKTPQ